MALSGEPGKDLGLEALRESIALPNRDPVGVEMPLEGWE